MNKGERTLGLLAVLGVGYIISKGWLTQFKAFVMSSVGQSPPTPASFQVGAPGNPVYQPAPSRVAQAGPGNLGTNIQ